MRRTQSFGFILHPFFLTPVLVLCLTGSAWASQKWTRAYGGTGTDVGYSTQQTTDGGYIVAGSTTSFGAGGSDVYLVKTNASGDTLWTRTYGGTSNDVGYSVQQTSDGGYIIAGYTASFGAGGNDFYLIKTNASGDTLWTRTYGGTGMDFGYSVQQTTDGGYIVGGYTTSFGAGNDDVYLVKTNASGDTLWTRSCGGAGEDYGYDVKQTADGGYVIAGVTFSFGHGNGDVYLVKTNASGDTLWTRAYGGTNSDYGRAVRESRYGGDLVAGMTRSFGTGDWDVYLIKAYATGDTVLTRHYGGTGEDQGYAILETLEGDYLLAGSTTSYGAGGSDVYLVKTYTFGDTVWTRTFGGTGSDIAYSVQQCSDGGFILAGSTTSYGAGGAMSI